MKFRSSLVLIVTHAFRRLAVEGTFKADEMGSSGFSRSIA
jgi:hypothetical protein